MGEVRTTVTLKDIQKIAGQIVERFRPQKVILFGSYARGKPTVDSDVDLMVLLDTDENSLTAACRIARDIEHPVRFEIHVRRPFEFYASVKRKGIFASEIASHGIVLYEDAAATKKTLEEVSNCGEESFSMKPETTESVNKAEGDLSVAEREMQAAKPILDAVCFHAQQCAEKYLKALLEEHNIMFQKTHDLVELRDLAGEVLKELDSRSKELTHLTGLGISGRYPGTEASQEEAENALRLAGEVRAVVRAKLGLPLTNE